MWDDEMQITIDTLQRNINWGARGVDRIAQNITNLLSTFKYEVAYDRTLGMSGNFIDKPKDVAIALATAEIYELIALREPRAKVVDVLFVGLYENENMQFKVVVEV
jgi:phage baseplate assembly protein W